MFVYLHLFVNVMLAVTYDKIYTPVFVMLKTQSLLRATYTRLGIASSFPQSSKLTVSRSPALVEILVEPAPETFSVSIPRI